jgi:hypothetical protein
MPSGVYVRRVRSTEERFWPKVDKNGPIPEERPEVGPCWLWTDVPSKDGYGYLSVGGGVKRPAHCVAYEIIVGPIPPKHDIDHLCRNRRCVRAPDHLEPVTRRINLLRGKTKTARNAAATQCPRGHQLSPYVPGKRRQCVECNRMWSRIRYARRKAS